jgi:hypothetical protein
MARALKPHPEFEVLDGALWPDAWTTPRLALELAPEARDRMVRVTITNPHFNTAYLRNTVRLVLDGETAFSDLVFAGHGVRVERLVLAKAPLLIELTSEATLEPDALDDRARGVWLKLSHKPVEKKA